jgi:calcineurin-like phosphoesterase family protein
MTDFFTSDLHLGHKHVIEYCNRPFSSVEEMDEVIINNWNSVISKCDRVFILGDLLFDYGGGSYEKIIKRLQGRKYLVEGNHDKFKKEEMGKLFPEGFGKMKVYKNKGIHITLCHYAMRVWPLSHYNTWHLFGHSHGFLEPEGKSWDIGVDNNKFMPLNLDEVVGIMEKRPNNFNYKGDTNGR